MLGFVSLGVDTLASGYGSAPAAAFQELLNARNGAGAYLVEIDAYAGGDVRLGGAPLLGAGLLGETTLAGTAPFDASAAGAGLFTIRLSDTGWIGLPTDADRANVQYEPRIRSALSIERQIPTTPEAAPRISRQIGDIEFDNADGAYDDAASSWAVDGRVVRVYFGPADGVFADFGLIAEVLGVIWEIGEARGRLSVRDRRYALDKPIQTDLYAGTGDAEGSADLEGKPRPLCWGKVRNIAPALVDSTNLIYEFHARKAQAVDAVYDQGLALTDSTNTAANFAALQLLAVAAGQFAVSLSSTGSYVKLGSSPAGLITADVRGDAEPDYADTIDVICLRILRTDAGLPDSVINTGSWAGLVAVGGTIGIYLDQLEVVTTATVLDRLVQSVGGFWGAGRDGRLRSGRLAAPEDRSAIFFFEEPDILEYVPDPIPIPRYRQRIGYQRRWTVQTEDLAGAVTDERRQFLAEPQSVVTALDTAIRVRHPEAVDPEPLPSFYDQSANAQTLADTLLALHKVDRRVFSIRVKRLGYQLDLGQVVSVTYARLGQASGNRFVIVGIREEADRDEQTLTLWG